MRSYKIAHASLGGDPKQQKNTKKRHTEESDRMRTQLAEHEEVREREREARRGGEAYPGRRRTTNMPCPRLRAIEDAFARFGNSNGRGTDRRHHYLIQTLGEARQGDRKTCSAD